MSKENHLGDEEIENYSLRAIPEAELARVEEHLLLCAPCRERVESSDIYVASMAHAGARLRRQPEPRRIWVPVLAFAALAAVVLLGVILVPRQGPAPFAVALSATRGPGIEAKAPAGTTLLLQPDVTGLPAAGSYRAEMVDQNGKQVWTGSLPGASVKPVPAGTYFVRLYGPSGELLREFGLEIESRQ